MKARRTVSPEVMATLRRQVEEKIAALEQCLREYQENVGGYLSLLETQANGVLTPELRARLTALCPPCRPGRPAILQTEILKGLPRGVWLTAEELSERSHATNRKGVECALIRLLREGKVQRQKRATQRSRPYEYARVG